MCASPATPPNRGPSISVSDVVPIGAVTPPDRWQRGGVSPRPRCAERGCPFPPGDSGRCPEHAEPDEPQHGYWPHGNPPPKLPPPPPVAELAASWVRDCCEFDPAFPFVSCFELFNKWSRFVRRQYGSQGSTGTAPLHVALIAAGAVPAQADSIRRRSGYLGVRIRADFTDSG